MPYVQPSPPTARTRIVGLDGLRALAALLVLIFHLFPHRLGVGYVGVDMFFVLSGFLITALLLRERNVTGHTDLRAFWVRRARRLVPAVAVATVGSIALARCFGGDSLVQLRWQTLGALTGTYNWLEIVNGSSYFEKQSPLLLTNMWSLAVEQQFYLFWPLGLLLIIRYLPRRYAPYVTLGLGSASVILHVVYISLNDDVTRAYVGTDSHLFGLMIGAGIALWVPRVMVGPLRPAPAEEKKLWGVLAWVGLVGALALGIFLPDGPWMYPWGMFVVSACTGFVVRGLMPDAISPLTNRLVAFLEWRPMTWIGERSYGIYLWHWPLWVIATYNLRWGVFPIAVMVLGLSLLLAHLSYNYIETPIRRRGFREYMRGVWATITTAIIPARVGAAVSVAVVASLFLWGMATSPAMSTAQRYVAEGRAALEKSKSEGEGARGGTGQEGSENAERPEDADNATDNGALSIPSGDEITIIGDSVTLAAVSALEEEFPGSIVDAEESRSIRAVTDIVNNLKTKGELREYVVVGLATNATIRESDVKNLLAAVGPDRKIVMVTGYGPSADGWIDEANTRISAMAADYPGQVRVADWAAIAAKRPELLAGDRVHPGPEASKRYAEEIARALDSF